MMCICQVTGEAAGLHGGSKLRRQGKQQLGARLQGRPQFLRAFAHQTHSAFNINV